MRLLITGASGLLGSKLAEKAHRTHEIFSGYNAHQPQKGTPIKLDITNQIQVENAFRISKPDVVIHCAAMTHVDYCERNPQQATEINVHGTQNIVNQTRKQRSHLIYVSTDYVFDGEKGNYNEEDQTNPINHYGRTKLDAEKIVQEYPHHTVVRTCVIYGSTPAAGKINFALWIRDQLKPRKQVNIITDQIVTPTLNTNLAEMILEIAERKLMGTYHLAGTTQIDRYSYAKELAQKFNLDMSLINPTTSDKMNWTAKRPMNSSLNVEKATTVLDHKPLNLKDSLNLLYEEITSKEN